MLAKIVFGSQKSRKWRWKKKISMIQQEHFEKLIYFFSTRFRDIPINFLLRRIIFLKMFLLVSYLFSIFQFPFSYSFSALLTSEKIILLQWLSSVFFGIENSCCRAFGISRIGSIEWLRSTRNATFAGIFLPTSASCPALDPGHWTARATRVSVYGS